MKEELLLFQIGPVQEFIAQAETGGDLRAGSELLSEVTAAALKVVPDYDQHSVFPAVEKDSLEGIPNRFLAFVPSGDGERIAKEASNAAKDKLRSIAKECWNNLSQKDEVIKKNYDAFMAQVESFLHISWVVLKNPTGNMGEDYRTIGKLMAMRRNVREFDAWHEECYGKVKDFLSGKEAALDVADNSSGNKNSGRGAMNLIKRFMSDKMDFGQTQTSYHYIAVIAMDGDHMGERLSSFTTKEEHCAFSKKLSEFAGKVAIDKEDGFLIYAGGDDVLAVVKATRAIETAKKLAEQFSKTMSGNNLTVSAGIAIGSIKAPLQESGSFGACRRKPCQAQVWSQLAGSKCAETVGRNP